MNPNPPGHRPLRPIDPSNLRPQRKVFDVARPGRTPASSTSRPVVTGHQPAVRDMSVQSPQSPPALGTHRPMMGPRSSTQPSVPVGLDGTSPVPQQAAAPVRRVGPTIAPLASAPKPPQLPVPPAPQPQVAPRPAATAPVRPQPSVHPPAFTPAPRMPQGMGTTVNDMPPDVDRVDPIQLHDDEPVLISKHVPHDQSTKWRWIIIASLVFLFLLVLFDILLDADFITLRQVPHTHFF